MMRVLVIVLALAATAAGVAGLWLDVSQLAPRALWLLLGGLTALILAAFELGYTGPGAAWPRDSDQPRPIAIRPLDGLRSVQMWLHAFQRTYAVEPGLYYTGERYDLQAPLLVTGNYLLSVLLLLRATRGLSMRLLVVDSDGINVWCASGKGRFSTKVIADQLERYDRALLGDEKRPTLVLPKLSLAGVDLAALRRLGVRPLLGPIYAQNLSAWLAEKPLRSCDTDLVDFNLRSRLFCWLPGLVQYLGYSLGVLLALYALELLGGPVAPLGLVPLVAVLGSAYPLLVPWIAGGRFAIMGLWLGVLVSLGLVGLAGMGWLAWAPLASAVPFTVAMSIFVGLSFTGNSAVSNYSLVRKEIAHFLPVDLLLFIAAFVAYLVVEVPR